jgi:D-ribose pyranose/furanose isomerase RbsD
VSALPGFALAMALVEKELAVQRAIMSGEVYRTSARAGHDIAKVSSIYTTIENGKPMVRVEFADLVEQAEE